MPAPSAHSDKLHLRSNLLGALAIPTAACAARLSPHGRGNASRAGAGALRGPLYPAVPLVFLRGDEMSKQVADRPKVGFRRILSSSSHSGPTASMRRSIARPIGKEFNGFHAS